MDWVAITVDPNDHKVKIDWLYLMKIVLGTIRGDQFLYIFLKLVTSIILITAVILS